LKTPSRLKDIFFIVGEEFSLREVQDKTENQMEFWIAS